MFNNQKVNEVINSMFEKGYDLFSVYEGDEFIVIYGGDRYYGWNKSDSLIALVNNYFVFYNVETLTDEEKYVTNLEDFLDQFEHVADLEWVDYNNNFFVLENVHSTKLKWIDEENGN